MNAMPSMPSRERQALLQAGLDMIEEGLTVFDGELRLVAWNSAFLRLLAFPAELAYEGASFESFIRYNARRGEYSPEDPESAIAVRVAAARAFSAHVVERVRPDGRVLRVVGQPLAGHGFVTVYSDISEQRRAERAVRDYAVELEHRVAERTADLDRSEQQMRLIIDSIPALVAYVGTDRIYRYINRGYRAWFGLDPARPGAVSAREFLGERTYLAIRPHVSRAFAGEAVSFEYEIDRIDGKRIPVRTSLIPDSDQGRDGAVAGCFELTFDLTEQRQAQDLLLRAGKLDALGQLTGGLAHDFNNILTVVIGNLGALAQARAGDPLLDELVTPAIDAARRGAELIKGLLSFSRQQPLQSRACAVAPLIDSVGKLVRRSLPDTLDLRFDVVDEGLRAWIDPYRLENALLNLILNARDATGGRGTVRVRAAAQQVGAERAAAWQVEAGSFVRIEVSDDGPGMDEATRGRIFEPFFTTKRPGQGTGLGLSMVYGFVRQSGGAIDVESAPGRGCTLSIWLPACTEAVDDEDMPRGERVLPPSESRGLALLVEDDAGVRQVVRRMLLELGHVVLEAESGSEAIAILDQTPGIALLVTDVVMPGGVDGRAVAAHARDHCRVPRVLLMSGYVPGAPETADLDGLPLLAKPFSRDQLAALLDLEAA